MMFAFTGRFCADVRDSQEEFAGALRQSDCTWGLVTAFRSF